MDTMEFIKWLFIIACCIGVIGGTINGIINMKHGKKRSSHGLLGVLFILSGLLDKFNDDK